MNIDHRKSQGGFCRLLFRAFSFSLSLKKSLFCHVSYLFCRQYPSKLRIHNPPPSLMTSHSGKRPRDFGIFRGLFSRQYLSKFRICVPPEFFEVPRPMYRGAYFFIFPSCLLHFFLYLKFLAFPSVFPAGLELKLSPGRQKSV